MTDKELFEFVEETLSEYLNEKIVKEIAKDVYSSIVWNYEYLILNECKLRACILDHGFAFCEQIENGRK